MPKLGVTKLIRLNLPSTENEANPEDRAWIDIRKTLTLGDVADINKLEDVTDKGIAMVAGLIDNWNFTDLNGEPIAATIESVRKLSPQDFEYITTWIQNNVVEQSKGIGDEENFTSTSTL